MTYYINLGYRFALPNKTGHPLTVEGSIVPACTMIGHQLVRRRGLESKYPHMKNRLFDPQLYLAELDANQSREHCSKLASYPWFIVPSLEGYDSSNQHLKDWQKNVEAIIANVWPGKASTNPNEISLAIADCIEFQRSWGCEAIILPSPLTTNPNTSYENELLWLDIGLEQAKRQKIDIPIFATIALTDHCLTDSEPLQSVFLNMVMDVVTAREVDGVYFVLEQGRELSETKHCSNTRALRSVLHLVHTLSQDAELKVVVNFLGQFGLVCKAVGADVWASEWYKSNYRLRLADKMGYGMAHPSYWSHPAAIDVHLKDDFDKLNQSGVIAQIVDYTEASYGLMMAAAKMQSPSSVPAWKYGPNNVTATREHFLRSCIKADKPLSGCSREERLDLVTTWLESAAMHAVKIESILGRTSTTNTRHVQAWLDALRSYRVDHNV